MRNHGSDDSSDAAEDTASDTQPIDPRLLRRLFVAFLIIAGLTLVSVVFLPRAGLVVPWYVFALVFLVIVAAALAPALEGRMEADPVEDEDVAGRIGSGGYGSRK